jgi:hypothetical protein
MVRGFDQILAGSGLISRAFDQVTGGSCQGKRGFRLVPAGSDKMPARSDEMLAGLGFGDAGIFNDSRAISQNLCALS